MCVHKAVNEVKAVRVEFSEAYFKENEVAEQNHEEVNVLTADTLTLWGGG